MSKKKIKKVKITSKERYEFLINARNFHYENFNKWTTYFYVAIGTLFVGYYTLVTQQKELLKEEIALLILGYTTSLFWYWSTKGYYYWNINFITLVNECEKDLLKLAPEERIYYVFANKETQNNYWNPISGANISTSKVAILFSFIVTLVWNVLLFDKLNSVIICNFNFLIVFTFSIILTLLLSYSIPQTFLKSKIDHFPNLKIEQKKE
ncbi:hypothetical protein SY27_17525 [Flavobacterium sp. 316]|uniref:RipA family octameric membrane protein n=1 Tax=Flavobacterium sp. 316 TaxID=1603293 RepID=UPI0005E28EC5|nr:hypothetical protein [Flavobacterium sp. 316]KIX19845.1 hypothetical protein SY27_17525 [Flavobacterium sp. 316]